MSDGFLTLAQAPGGLTCFLVPRITPDGARNRIQLMRLKDKLGNRSNASAEIEYHGALACRLGEEGRGVADHHRDGAPHPARCTIGLRSASCAGALVKAVAPRRAPHGLRQAR